MADLQPSLAALLHAIDSQNRAEPKKKLVFVFSSCYKMLSSVVVGGLFSGFPVISVS